jgi:uncharacterized membrane protein YphA (DoxX/SURF4 family)
MLKQFNIAERGAGSYWVLGILRWVMVLIFISFGIQKFTASVGTEHRSVYLQQPACFLVVHIRDQG